MADEFDQAQLLDQLAVESARNLQEKRAAREPKLTPTGECQNIRCQEPLKRVRNPEGVLVMPLFCNSFCAAEHARRGK